MSAPQQVDPNETESVMHGKAHQRQNADRARAHKHKCPCAKVAHKVKLSLFDMRRDRKRCTWGSSSEWTGNEHDASATIAATVCILSSGYT